MNSLTEKLNPARAKELAHFLLKVEFPVSTRKLIEPLLELLVGGEAFDLSQNFLIKEPGALLVILELLPNLSNELQLEVWSTLGAILHQSLKNTSNCHQLGLADKCLEFLSKTENHKIASHIGTVLETLANYSMSVKQLKAVLSYLYNSHSDNCWAPHSVLLIGILNNIAVSVQPEIFFSFTGGHGSVFALPPLSKWPGQSGFTISMWIRCEKPYDTKRDYYKPVVYWFHTGRGTGYSAHFVGNNLVLETVGKNVKKPQTHLVDYIFHSFQWHMVVVVYQPHRLRSSEVFCYVDGLLALSSEVTLPSHDEVFDKCFLGGNEVGTPDSVFQGQMSTLYIWKVPLGNTVISVLHKLGPGYKSQFKFEAEIDCPLSPKEQKLLFDGTLASSLVVSYNAKAVDGQLCLEASPVEGNSFFAHSPHATMLEGVEPVVTTSVHSALHSLGGIQALFPLFSQLDTPQVTDVREETLIDYTLSVKLLSLVFELVRNSITYMFQLVQMRALELISYLLEKVSSLHLTEELLSSIFDFMRYLSTVSYGEELLLQLVEQLLFNSRLWIRGSKKVQIFLYSHLATEFCMQRLGTTSIDLRDVIGVSQLMFILKEYYGLASKEEKRANGDIRPYILLMIKQFVTKGKGIRCDELVSILNYLLSVPEEDNLYDVLQLLVALVFEDTNAILINLLKANGGIRVAARLLACASEELRINALKLMNKVLYHSTEKERQSLVATDGILIVIKEKLLSTGQPITVPMFNTLLQLMLNQPSRLVIQSNFLSIEPTHTIVFPGILPVMTTVISVLNNLSESLTVTGDKCDRSDPDDSSLIDKSIDQSMQLQLLTYINTLCSQNNHNCLALISVPEWQQMLVQLVDNSSEENEHLQALVYQLFHTTLLYAIKEEEEGWRLWTQIAATLHASRVSKGLVSLKTPNKTNKREGQSVDLTNSLTPELIKKPGSFSKPVEDDDSELDSSSNVSLTARSLSEYSGPQLPSPLVESISTSQEGSINRCTITSNSTTEGAIPEASTRKQKYPKFSWSVEHWMLFKRILNSIQSLMTKEKSNFESGNRSDAVSTNLVSNTIQLLVLSIDSFIGLVGGIKDLMTKACGFSSRVNRTKHTKEDTSSDVLNAEILLRQSLDLMDLLLLSGTRGTRCLVEIETRMNMEPGGVTKQCLRLVLVVATLDCIKVNMDYEDQQKRYHRHKIVIEQMKQKSKLLLKSIGIADTSLDKYVFESLHEKLMSLKDCQLVLSDESISRLWKTIPKEIENRSTLETVVSTIVYYLSVLCVARYKTILDSVERERMEFSLPQHSSPKPDSNISHYTIEGAMELNDHEDLLSSTPDLPLSCLSHTDSLDSSVASASDLKEERHNLTSSTPLHFFGSEDLLYPPTVIPLTQAVDVSEQVNVSLRLVGAFLCQLLVGYKSILSKVLITADGRQLLSEAALKLAEDKSIIEVTMLLCSQEWQTALQKTAAKHFGSLLNDGRHTSHFSDLFIKSLALKVCHNVRAIQDSSQEKFSNFEEELSFFLSNTIKASNDDRKMKRAEVLRHTQTADAMWRKLSLMVDNCGSFDFTPLKPSLLRRLDLKENSHRQRLKLLFNPNGSMHTGALRTTGDQSTQQELRLLDPSLVIRSPIAQDDDKITEEEGGEIHVPPDRTESSEASSVTIECGVIALAYYLSGTLSFTQCHFTFTADETSHEYSKVLKIAESCPLSDRWNMSDVTAVFSRYYLHQFKALEIFFTNKSSVFLVFNSSNERKIVVNLLPKVGIGSHYGLPQTRSISLSPPHQLFRKSDMTAKWIKREISNFDYLMFINTIAGRTFNDLSQYPVFPWILNDYTSEYLDVNNAAVYRDLTKPIGALNPTRLSQYQERYELWENDTIPSFHFGTHYSTMAFVVHWLVRVEPFTSIHIDLHDGFFDHGSRLFSSIGRAWNNCQVDSSDVKELIPEMFYLPEMLVNYNKYCLGFDEHGEFGEELAEGEVRAVNDVLLPPWAHTAEEFIRIHKKALESEYVSLNLHSWIDLIFGYKQTGPESVEATNVFYHVTYPGSVNWNAITDEYQLKALEQQVLQFGQTPRQLLKEPHPQRQSPINEFPPHPKSKCNPAIVAEIAVSLDVPIGCLHMSHSSSSLLVVNYNQLFAVYRWTCVSGTVTQPPLINLEIDQNHAPSLKVRLGDPLDQSISVSSLCFDIAHTGEYLLLCGYWDNSFKVFSTVTGLAVQSVFGHRGIVTCISFDAEAGLNNFSGDGLVATGSTDVTVLLWKWSGRQNRIISQLTMPQGSVTPLAILNGHEKTITCVTVSASHGLIASGAKQGCCLIHSISGELLHKLVPSNPWSCPHLISHSSEGLFIVHYADQKGCLAVFTCNGQQLCYKSLKEPALALTLSPDGNHIVIGGFSARVYILETHSLNLVYTYEQCESSIRVVHMSSDHRFIFVGLSSGIISVLATYFWR